MSCDACEAAQDTGELVVPVRVGNADVLITGCVRHAGQLLNTYRAGVFRQNVLDELREQTEIWQDAMRRVVMLNQLAVLLGGSEDSFTGRLLQLLPHADPVHLAALRTLYPSVVLAWEAWKDCDPAPTPAELWARISELAEKEL